MLASSLQFVIAIIEPRRSVPPWPLVVMNAVEWYLVTNEPIGTTEQVPVVVGA